MRISFGVGNRRIAKSIQKNNIERLSILSQKFSKKAPKEMEELIQKTITSLGTELSKDHVQSLFVGFVADLSKEEDYGLLTRIFNQNIVKDENLVRTFISAVVADQGMRAIKMIMAKPELLLVHVKEKKPAFLFFNEEAFKKLFKSGALNDDFFIGLLRGIKK